MSTRLVNEWMIERPLKHLPRCRCTACAELLSFLNETRVPTGVLSDYPAIDKLEALGIAGRFSLVLCADAIPTSARSSPTRAAFSRRPRAGSSIRREVLFVGDRADVDAAGAAAAGMPCVIIGEIARSRRSAAYLWSFLLSKGLRDVLDDAPRH